MLAALGFASVGCSLFPAKTHDVVRVETTRQSKLAAKANAEGLHWLDYGDLKLARCAFEKAIRRDPRFAPAHNNLGKMLFDAGDMAGAAAAFDAAIGQMPNNPVPQNNLGLALENGGRAIEALEHYQIAHDLDPSSPEFLGNLVRARLKLDPYDESVVPQLRELRFIEVRPDWVDWIEEQLAIRFNPYLDRGPAAPDLSALDEMNRDRGEAGDRESVLDVPDLTGPQLPVSGETLPPAEPLPLPDEWPVPGVRDIGPVGISKTGTVDRLPPPSVTPRSMLPQTTPAIPHTLPPPTGGVPRTLPPNENGVIWALPTPVE